MIREFKIIRTSSFERAEKQMNSLAEKGYELDHFSADGNRTLDDYILIVMSKEKEK